MPNARERLEVSLQAHGTQRSRLTPHQKILQVVARKLVLSAEVDLHEFVADTNGFSGADLQALLYNAHLDAIHTSLGARQENSVRLEDRKPISFVAFGGSEKTEQIVSRADREKIAQKVRNPLKALVQSKLILCCRWRC